MYSMGEYKDIKNLFQKQINIYSGREEYIYKDIIIVDHAIKRFGERIGKDYIYLFALIIINYENIINEINKNIKTLEGGDYIEILIKYKNIKFYIVVRKDKIYKDKYVIKTIKKDKIEYYIEKTKSIYNIN